VYRLAQFPTVVNEMAPSWPAVVTQLVGQSTYSAEVEHSNSFAAGQKLA